MLLNIIISIPIIIIEMKLFLFVLKEESLLNKYLILTTSIKYQITFQSSGCSIYSWPNRSIYANIIKVKLIEIKIDPKHNSFIYFFLSLL